MDPHPNTGMRRYCLALRAAEALADGFAGLGDGLTRWRLAAALRTAARRLALSESMLRLLEHYIDLTYDQDWDSGSEPVITRPLVEIAEHLGKSERQVRNIERALVERGLLAWRDSGNHHRKGWRDRTTGRLVYAYGPSLGPLGARAAEILAVAEEERRTAALRRHVRLKTGALRRQVHGALAAAELAGLTTDDMRRTLGQRTARRPSGTPLETLMADQTVLESVLNTLQARLHGGRAPTGEAPVDKEISGKPEIPAPQIPDTDTETACIGNRHETNMISSGPRIRRSGAKPTIGPDLVLRVAGPTVRAMTEASDRIQWQDLADAAARAAPLLGIGQSLWGETCATLGRNGAAVAITVMEHGLTRPGNPVRDPVAYLTAMLHRSRSGMLHLDRSIHGLAARQAYG